MASSRCRPRRFVRRDCSRRARMRPRSTTWTLQNADGTANRRWHAVPPRALRVVARKPAARRSPQNHCSFEHEARSSNRMRRSPCGSFRSLAKAPNRLVFCCPSHVFSSPYSDCKRYGRAVVNFFADGRRLVVATLIGVDRCVGRFGAARLCNENETSAESCNCESGSEVGTKESHYKESIRRFAARSSSRHEKFWWFASRARRFAARRSGTHFRIDWPERRRKKPRCSI